MYGREGNLAYGSLVNPNSNLNFGPRVGLA